MQPSLVATRFGSFALLLSALFSGSAQAQEGQHPGQPDELRAGIGLSLDAFGSLELLGYYDPEYIRYSDLLDTRSVRVPLILPGGWRVEPTVAISGFSQGSYASSFFGLSVATGPSWKVGANATGYAGGRLGSNFLVETDEGPAVDLSAAALLGGEYWIARNLSLGGETWLGVTRLDEGQPEGHWTLNLSGDLMLRFYLK